MINPIAARALADALRDERKPPPLRRDRPTRRPLRARLASALRPRRTELTIRSTESGTRS
jgi:hypothetical protein